MGNLITQKTRLSASSLTENNADALCPDLSMNTIPKKASIVKCSNVDPTGIEPANPDYSDPDVHQYRAHKFSIAGVQNLGKIASPIIVGLAMTLLLIPVPPAFAGELANQFTISIWINPQTSIASKALVVKDSEIRLVTDASGNPLCQIYASGAWQTAITSSTALTLNSWAHVSCTYNKANIYVYVNGTQTGSGAQTNAVNDAATNLLTGQDDSGTYGNFIGITDNLQVYNYARTQKQIIEDMGGGHPSVIASGARQSGPVGYWKFDEGYGTTANDSAGNSNSLTLSSASWTDSGKFGKAWNGTGALWSSRADDDDFDFVAADDGAISLWFKSDSASNPGATEYLFNKGPTSAAGYSVYANTSGNICFGVDDDATWTPDDSACSTTDIYDATWHSIVAIKTGTSRIDLYVDGKSNASDTSIAATGTLANSSTMYIGDLAGSDNGDEFNGDLDEIKVYRYALTASEVATEYNRGSSLVLGALSDNSSYQPQAANQEYCIPGDSTSCTAPVGRWDFEEGTGTSASDTSGNANTGTLTAGPTWAQGKIGKAINFDGSNDCVSVSNASSLNMTSAITIEAWVYPTSLTGAPTIIQKQDGFTGQYFLRFNSGLNGGLWISGAWREITSASSAVANQWQHVAFTYDGTNMRLFYNGANVATTARTGSITTTTGTLGLGAWTSCSENAFTGRIDHARIYNYARSAAQIAWDYNRGAPVGHWKFDEGQGTTVNDSSGNSNSGTITIGGTGTQTSAGDINTSSTAWYNGKTGKRNYSLNFDGTDDYVAVADNSLHRPSTITVAAWIKYSGVGNTSDELIASKWGPGTNGWYLGYDTSNGVNANQIRWLTANNSQNNLYSATVTLSASWHHIATTLDGSGNAVIYLDGISIKTGSGALTSTGNTAPMEIGSYNTGTRLFNGQIDDVRIFNYALTATQVKLLMNEGAVRFGPSTGAP